MKILVSGSSGLVGSALIPALVAQGHSVVSLVRGGAQSPSTIPWNLPQAGPDPKALEGIQAVVHLAGESIASGRWTESKKKSILESRVACTRLLSVALAAMPVPPSVLISASAIGYYGDRGNDLLPEGSSAGNGFLPDVCKAWEAATQPAVAKGIRVVHSRFGIILSPKGGALAKMLLPFKLGLGGMLGSGQQYMSWIALDDVVSVVQHALSTPSLSGAVNTVAPEAVTNAVFTKTLGRTLGRPTIFPMPAFAARLVFGEMADALLLSSARVTPSVLLRSNYRFAYPQLPAALQHLLKK